jgi:hypothetical protein
MVSKEFLLAGRAMFSITMPEDFANKNGLRQSLTYRIAKKPDSNVWFVSLLAGKDSSDYNYIGMLNTDTGEVNLTRSSHINSESLVYKLINRVLKNIWGGTSDKIVEAGFKVENLGKCGRCGGKLLTEESIKRGIGPECLAMLGLS